MLNAVPLIIQFTLVVELLLLMMSTRHHSLLQISILVFSAKYTIIQIEQFKLSESNYIPISSQDGIFSYSIPGIGKWSLTLFMVVFKTQSSPSAVISALLLDHPYTSSRLSS